MPPRVVSSLPPLLHTFAVSHNMFGGTFEVPIPSLPAALAADVKRFCAGVVPGNQFRASFTCGLTLSHTRSVGFSPSSSMSMSASASDPSPTVSFSDSRHRVSPTHEVSGSKSLATPTDSVMSNTRSTTPDGSRTADVSPSRSALSPTVSQTDATLSGSL